MDIPCQPFPPWIRRGRVSKVLPEKEYTKARCTPHGHFEPYTGRLQRKAFERTPLLVKIILCFSWRKSSTYKMKKPSDPNSSCPYTPHAHYTQLPTPALDDRYYTRKNLCSSLEPTRSNACHGMLPTHISTSSFLEHAFAYRTHHDRYHGRDICLAFAAKCSTSSPLISSNL